MAAALSLKPTMPRRSTSNNSGAIRQKNHAYQDISDDDSDDDDDPLSDLEKAGTKYEGKGKAPVRDSDDVEMLNGEDEEEDEDIDEGEFDDEDMMEDEEEDNFDDEDEDDAKSHISVSSNQSKISHSDEVDGISTRPWKHMNTEQRASYEYMFSMVTDHAINSSWSMTEEYQREKDKEMLRYMEDWPLPAWVIGKQQAEAAYFRLLERTRWRQCGVAIYGNDRLNEQIPGSVIASRLQQTLNVAPHRYPHHPSERVPPVPAGPVHLQYTPQANPFTQPPPRPAPRPQAPPQHQMLPSQPNAQPMQVMPGQHMPHPMGQPPPDYQMYQQMLQQMVRPPGMPPGMHPNMHGMPPQHVAYAGVQQMHQPQPVHAGGQYMQHLHQTMGPGQPRQPKPKAPTPPAATPPPPPPTPPYPKREKPTERKVINKSGKRNQRKQAEADEFPWTREDINFKEARDKATWDDTIYPKATLDTMAATRARNAPYIHKLDMEQAEKQKMQRVTNKMKKVDASSDGEGEDGKPKKKRKETRPRVADGGDPYHSGNFAFSSEDDRLKALGLKYRSPDDLIAAGTAGKVSLEECEKVNICWNPGKKGLTQDLEQAPFSVKDTVLTRKQLAKTPILTKRAAECIVDFCPDMLWRDMLLRIASEAGYGNKDVRDRFCLNGCHADKATITKRISAALGQKQKTPTSSGYREGELEWFENSTQEFDDYIRFFGKRSSHRHMLKLGPMAVKRRRSEDDDMDGSDNKGSSSPDKRARTEDATESPDAIVVDDDEEEDDDPDAVSEQDDDMLDEFSD